MKTRLAHIAFAAAVAVSRPTIAFASFVKPRIDFWAINALALPNIDEHASSLFEIKSVLPTTLTSAELADIPQEILDRAKFMAQVTKAEYLQEAYDILDDIRSGELDMASGILRLQEFAKSIEYNPVKGLPEEGTLADPVSHRRIKQMLTTNLSTARGFGQFQQAQLTIDAAPGWELYRAFNRKVPRKWLERWSEAGGPDPAKMHGRLIALKDDSVWKKLGDKKLFKDALGNPYAPFAYGSGMRTRSVDRAVCVEFGLIGPDEQIEPQTRDFNQDLQVNPDVRAAALRQVLEEEGHTFNGDVLVP